MTKHISLRGKVVDFNRLQQSNATKPALGNANMNARGDIITKTGVILKTQEQIEAEWAANRKRINDSIAVDIKAEPTVEATPTKVLDLDDASFEPTTPTTTSSMTTSNTRRRKISEED